MIKDTISASVEAIADPAIPNFKVNINLKSATYRV